jgi:hypothetical protein
MLFTSYRRNKVNGASKNAYNFDFEKIINLNQCISPSILMMNKACLE